MSNRAWSLVVALRRRGALYTVFPAMQDEWGQTQDGRPYKALLLFCDGEGYNAQALSSLDDSVTAPENTVAFWSKDKVNFRVRSRIVSTDGRCFRVSEIKAAEEVGGTVIFAEEIK